MSSNDPVLQPYKPGCRSHMSLNNTTGSGHTMTAPTVPADPGFMPPRRSFTFHQSAIACAGNISPCRTCFRNCRLPVVPRSR